MKLLLSSCALPGGTLPELAAACRRRALAGVELQAETLHGTTPAGEAEVAVPWVHLLRGASPQALAGAVSAARRFGAGLLTSEPHSAPLPHVPLALVHGTCAADARQAAAWARYHGVATAWTVAPGDLEKEEAAQVLALTTATLAHVRLLGSGPEGHAHEGLGTLMAHLALGGFAGTISLAPSPGANLDDWAGWLSEKRGWGCGSAAQPRVLVPDLDLL